jgi:hypothetical protein
MLGSLRTCLCGNRHDKAGHTCDTNRTMHPDGYISPGCTGSTGYCHASCRFPCQHGFHVAAATVPSKWPTSAVYFSPSPCEYCGYFKNWKCVWFLPCSLFLNRQWRMCCTQLPQQRSLIKRSEGNIYLYTAAPAMASLVSVHKLAAAWEPFPTWRNLRYQAQHACLATSVARQGHRRPALGWWLHGFCKQSS